jgi:hypothetical protein
MASDWGWSTCIVASLYHFLPELASDLSWSTGYIAGADMASAWSWSIGYVASNTCVCWS